MPYHSHEVPIYNSSGTYQTNAWEIMIHDDSITSNNKLFKTNTTHVGTSGEGKPHNNISPYIVTYFWRRTK